jgi:hypothetical protein
MISPRRVGVVACVCAIGAAAHAIEPQTTTAGGTAGDTAAMGSSAPAQPALQQMNGIAYMSGGVGADERHALDAMRGQFNLKVTVAAPTGEFIAPDQLRLSNQQGRTLVETKPDGPVFLAKVPPGAYSVAITHAGQQVTRPVMVSNAGQQDVTLTAQAAELPSRAGDAPELPRPAVPEGAAPGAEPQFAPGPQ